MSSCELIQRSLLSLVVVAALGCRGERKEPQAGEASERAGDAKPAKAKAKSPKKKPTGYWGRPVPHQPIPATWGALESTRQPKDCGVCHPSQLADWKTALHSQAMSPGLLGQILAESRDSFTRSCYACHAPLVEQHRTIENDAGEWEPNPHFDQGLHEAGVACVVCHMRDSKIHGPEPRHGGPRDMSKIPHDGFVIDERFQSSKLCAACHQFPKGWPELNGKLLENTYEEWKDSPAAKEGKTCQSCHMPDRRHTFRGIHDPDMTRSAFEFHSDLSQGPDGKLVATATLTNVGAGHMAPTYVPPRIEITFQQLDSAGRAIGAPSDATVIQRQVLLGQGKGNNKELSDTRLAPGEGVTASWQVTPLPGAAAVRAKVFCIPDHYYEEFYKRLLDRYDEDGEPHRLIEKALRHAQGRRFTVFANDMPVR